MWSQQASRPYCDPVTRSARVEGERIRTVLLTAWCIVMGALVGWTGASHHYVVTVALMLVFVLIGVVIRHTSAAQDKHRS
jgi:uncharacterized membrane protein